MSMTLEHIKATGEWWSDPWWLNSEGLDDLGYKKEEVVKAFDTLKLHFDQEWTKSLAIRPIKNIIFPHLCLMRGLQPLSFLTHLGLMLDRLKDKRGIKSKIKDLKGLKSESALFEIEMADIFVGKHYEAFFPKEGKNKSPDIMIDVNNAEVAIECKRLEEEAWARWQQDLMHDGIRHFPNELSKMGVNCQILLDPKLSEIRLDEKKEPEINKAINDAIIAEIAFHIKKMTGNAKAYCEKVMPGLGRIVIGPETEVSESLITGMHISDASITRRLLNNGILRAERQLPDHLPGIIAIFSPHLPENALMALVLRAISRDLGNRFNHIAAILFFKQSTIFQAEKPVLFKNDYSDYKDKSSKAIEVLRDKLNPLII